MSALVSLCWPMLLGQDRPAFSGNVRSAADIATALYGQVLALIFPWDRHEASDQVFVLSAILRRNNMPEARIVVRQGRGSTAIVEYSVADLSIDQVLSGASRERDPAALAKQIHVDRRAFQVASARAFEWQKALLLALASSAGDLQDRSRAYYETGSVEVTLDGDTFDIEYRQGMTRLGVHFSDPDGSAIKAWAVGLQRDAVAMAVKK